MRIWTKIPGFLEEVRHVGCKPTPHTQPIRILHHKLAETAKHLRNWSRSILFENKLELHMALEVIHHVDIAQESRPLTNAEFQLRKGLKRNAE